jgi:glycosyltransferase involved in cell wall biosynthesis
LNPKVSVIVPCYNERATIDRLLQGISDQTYPKDAFEVIVADGMSTDGTRDIIEAYSKSHPELSLFVIENPTRVIPAALNRAIAQARGDVIVRLDAHSIPRADYLERCLNALENTGAANVGGVWEIRPSENGWTAAGIAIAAAHPLGAGDARYRLHGEAGEVDTVPFGAFSRHWLDRVGQFDEKLLSNEDYEYNVRLRRAGGVIWFDPSIRSIYLARGDLASLARQYARYGYWKARMLLRYPSSLRWRQALPPAFLLSLFVLLVVSIWWPPARLLLGAQLMVYGLVTILAGGLEALRGSRLGLIFGVPLALWTMHLAWGGAFLYSLATKGFRGNRG